MLKIENIASNTNTRSDDLRLNYHATSKARISDKIALIVIILFSLISIVPGIFSTPPIDREESKFVVESKHMLDTGDFLKIRELGAGEHEKTIGTFWLQTLSVKFFGLSNTNSIWAYRLPTLFGAILSAIAVYWCVRAFTESLPALMTALMIPTTLLFGIFARIANSDVLLLACVVIAQGALARIWLEKYHRIYGLASLFWLSITAGMLIGGPYGPMVILLTIFSLSLVDRRIGWIRNLKPFLGTLFFISSVVPWIIAINYKNDGKFIVGSVVGDLFGRLGHGLDILGSPPLTHLLMMQITFWPISVFAILVIPLIYYNWRNPPYKFFLAWALSTWLVLEFVALKLPNNTLQILPAIASVSVIALLNSEIIWRKGRIIGAFLIVFIPIAIVAVSIGLPIYLEEEPSIFGIILCCSGLIVAFFTAYQLLTNGRPVLTMLCALIAAMLLNLGIFGRTLPELSSIRISQNIATKVMEISICPDPKFGSLDYSEPSLEFYVGRVFNLRSVEQAVFWLTQSGCRIAIVDDSHYEEYQIIVSNYSSKPVKRAEIVGFNYNTGKEQKLHIIQSNIKKMNSTF